MSIVKLNNRGVRSVTAFGSLIKQSDNLTRSEKRRLSFIKDQLSVLKKIIKENQAGLELSIERENKSRNVPNCLL